MTPSPRPAGGGCSRTASTGSARSSTPRWAYYEQITDQLVGLAHVTMSELGRRPRAGVDLRSVVVATHFILDGAVVRRLVDPDGVPARLVAEAMYQLWIAFSQPGVYDDPRKPDDDRNLDLFDAHPNGPPGKEKSKVCLNDNQGKPEVTTSARFRRKRAPDNPRQVH